MPDKDKCNEDILKQTVEDDGNDERVKEAIPMLDELENVSVYAGAQDFIDTMCSKRDKYGEEMFVSEGQLDWLRKLHDQYC